MGSEQSTGQGASETGKRQVSLDASGKVNLRRQHTIANPGAGVAAGAAESPTRPRSTSPGQSVCSDVDLPYISYTVNRPIGDSPKLANKQPAKAKPAARRAPAKPPKRAHSVVLVNAAASAPRADADADVARLRNVPMFLPIMRATLNLPAARDPEVLERLDHAPLLRLCVRYQNHLTACASVVATEQNALAARVRETDQEVNRIMAAATEKQRRFAKYAEKLCKVQELSHQLNRCHMLLNETLESMDTLNNLLSIDDRLEPFIWTTG